MQSSRWKTQLLFDSDEEYSNFYQPETATLDKDTALRTRLFEDEESRDSGVGMGNDIEDAGNLDLPVRSFPIFAEHGRSEDTSLPVFQYGMSEAFTFSKVWYQFRLMLYFWILIFVEPFQSKA